MKQPLVVGLPLDVALRLLEDSGTQISGIEKVDIPADFRRRAEDSRRTIECVAGARGNKEGGIVLITVSVPQTPKDGIPEKSNV